MTQPSSEPAEPEFTHLGAHLKSLREHYELSPAQVAEHLHIRPKYIEAIEAGDMSALPEKVYTQGYIQAYAEFLGLDARAILKQYESLSVMPEAGQFRVIEPTRQKGLPAWRLIVAAAGALVLLYLLIDWLGAGAANPALQSRIEPVPERLRKQAAAPLIITEQNEACLTAARYQSVLPCYYGAETMPKYHSIMELIP